MCNPVLYVFYFFINPICVLGTEVKEVAEFLSKDDMRLDRTIIGDFLGDPDPFNRSVMYTYVDMLDFSGKDLVLALRLDNLTIYILYRR